jgi:hypothetical protein
MENTNELDNFCGKKIETKISYHELKNMTEDEKKNARYLMNNNTLYRDYF